MRTSPVLRPLAAAAAVIATTALAAAGAAVLSPASGRVFPPTVGEPALVTAPVGAGPSASASST